MTMEENLKKSEFKSMIATVISTVTILCGFIIGGQKMKEAIVEDIKAGYKAEIRLQLSEHEAKESEREARQALRDREQDYKIEVVYQNMSGKK